MNLHNILFSSKIKGSGGGSGGGVSSYNDLTDKPFWKEVKKEPRTPYPLTVTTAFMNGLYACRCDIGVDYGLKHFVLFDGVEYECEPYYEENLLQTTIIGSVDFVGYPFAITNGFLVTETEGEHTVEVYVETQEIKMDYAPCLIIEAKMTADKMGQIDMEDVERIKNAFKNGIPIRLETIHKNQSVTMTVQEVGESFIFAYGYVCNNYGCMTFAAHEFGVKNGELYRYSEIRHGSIKDESDDNDYPIMCIGNRYYKITIGDAGNLIATQVT